MSKTLEISFFKQSGKWYMNEEIEIPEETFNQELFMSNGHGMDSGRYYYELREWLREYLTLEKRYSEFTAVCMDSDELGYPFMCHLRREEE